MWEMRSNVDVEREWLHLISGVIAGAGILFTSFFFVCLFLFLFFRDRVSLCSPGYPGTHFVDQAGLKLRNLPASASRVLGLKACATTPGYDCTFDFFN